jgi:hypothetical protein
LIDRLAAGEDKDVDSSQEHQVDRLIDLPLKMVVKRGFVIIR